MIGPLRARNRVVFGPHETNLGDGRSLSARHVAYYRRRAAGGVGVIVVEEASVHPSDWPYERAPLASVAAPGWGAIADACHVEGALVLAALGHAGGQGSSAYSQAPLWAPSRVPEVNTREVPKWMEPEDIVAVIEGFASAAASAIEAGCDGVEINAGQYSLVRQFLSGLTNLRDDEWGADRTEFARRVLAAVRSAVGPDAIVGLRLSADELAPWAGITPDDAPRLVAGLTSSIDSLTVVRGSIFSTAATRPDGHTPAGFNLDLVASLRDAVREVEGERVPVFAQGSLVDSAQAEWAVGGGARADGVEMTRALLADADLVAKLTAGAGDRIRPCILCNQTCQVRDVRNPPITCVVDPRTGHETGDPDETANVSAGAATVPVLVVGGGPAGLEAARVAATRGHPVRLVERSSRLGGAVRTAAAATGRERLAAIIDWYEAELDRLGVEISLDTEGVATRSDDVRVVAAVGSIAGDRSYRVDEGAAVHDVAAVLDGATIAEGPVLVWDPIGGPIGVSVAETLVAAGRHVTLATPDNIVGNELSRSGDLAPANARLQQAGVVLERRTILRSVGSASVELEDRFSGVTRSIPAVAVIDASPRLPAPIPDVFGGRADLLRAGDDVAPRTIHEAILEGRRAALALDGIGRVSDGVPMGDPGH